MITYWFTTHFSLFLSSSSSVVHNNRLYAKGFVAQDFNETLRGADLTSDDIFRFNRVTLTPNVPEGEHHLGFWDGITEDYGYSLFETPEWPKPAECRSIWGPTNRRYAGT